MTQGSFSSSACQYIAKKSLWTQKDLILKPLVHEDEDIILQMTGRSKRALVLQDIFFNM